MSEAALSALQRRPSQLNPIENPAPLANAVTKTPHIHGDEDTLVSTNANPQNWSGAIGNSAAWRIVLDAELPATKRSHDGPELYESAALLQFLLAD